MRRNTASGAMKPPNEAGDDIECTLGNASLVGQSSMPGRKSRSGGAENSGDR
jgi:hypothetical protein